MKADLSTREPQIQEKWAKDGLYHQVLASKESKPHFVLHDGPPYTNGPIHMGTALNKVLKDFVLKSRTMMGYRCAYVPGYDNHGLPIEQAVMRKFNEDKITPTLTELRQACRAHAARYLAIQSEQFQRLGIQGLWEKPYTTMDYKFEAGILRVFKRMVEAGYVYKGLRPTLWSPTSRTALADTELVYKDVVDQAIYVAFPLKNDPNKLFETYPNLSTIIWTTTPWTIPANLAVAFHPDLEYSVVKVENKHFLVVSALVEKLAQKLGWSDFSVVHELLGVNLENAFFSHPIIQRDSIAVHADYVTTEDGTGVVHTAPGHGRDDFYTGQRYNLPILCPVDEKGVMTSEAGEFEGLFYKKANDAVIDKLKSAGALLLQEDYLHSYPHAERDDLPVIFRATEQWFVSIDHNDLRQRMLQQIEKVDWVPATGQKRISSMIGGRPDWCISRQRPWGVGIPVLYGAKSGIPVLDPVVIEHVALLVERDGSDAWFTADPSTFLPADYRHPETDETEFVKETDVLDVWFDSGCTNLCVLEGDVVPEWKDSWPADLYLEGSDQHRGWFNTSLILATAVHGSAPYKQVVTHGFVNDEKGIKMSKRLGNIVDPVDTCNKYGADILRYWAASIDYTDDMPCGDSLLKTAGEHYRKIRNTVKFLMSNLFDYDGSKAPEIHELDQWIIDQADLLIADVVAAYQSYNFRYALTSIHNFCVSELSSFYLDCIKDRMYCDGPSWNSRKSGQVACHYVADALMRLIAPILPHTAEEINWKLYGEAAPSVHTLEFTVPDTERLQDIQGSALQTRFAALLELRGEVFAAFETWKVDAGVKDSQDVTVEISTPSEEIHSFDIEDLALYLKVSWLELTKGEPSYKLAISPYEKCDRSRLRRPGVQKVGEVLLTERDAKVLKERGLL